ncbi:MAG: prepilin-type N-terminal cleavage/methylation domain-containing protein [Gammaproteobacteria bacterium]|nr:MAG: prepilin-type N-terminal cleavage/methylation domain-containing protein [Gammaproteobacteria bacterium]
MDKSRAGKGFTLLELMVVVAIIAILAAMAMPSLEPKYARAQIAESVDLLKNLKENINLFYITTKKFPRDNSEAGIPKPEHLIGNYVERIDYVAGSFDIKFGSKALNRLKGKTISIRPIVVVDSPESPISWVCGNARAPAGMVAVGANKTNIENQFLPLSCN